MHLTVLGDRSHLWTLLDFLLCIEDQTQTAGDFHVTHAPVLRKLRE